MNRIILFSETAEKQLDLLLNFLVEEWSVQTKNYFLKELKYCISIKIKVLNFRVYSELLCEAGQGGLSPTFSSAEEAQSEGGLNKCRKFSLNLQK